MDESAAYPGFPRASAGHQYALDVTEGKILACKWVRLACQRYLDDLGRMESGAEDFPYTFVPALAEYPMQVAETFPHIKGVWAQRREKIHLKPFQCFVYAQIFGWVEREETRPGFRPRRFLKAKIYMPRKNAKSTGVAPIALFMLACDDEEGAEIYSGATTEKQANEVFRPAQAMARQTPRFLEKFGVQVNASTITVLNRNAKFETLIGKPGEGASPSCSIHDEYHEHDSDQQVNSMSTGMAAREQPLQIVISTAGTNIAGPCFQDWRDTEKILEGSAKDERTFGIIYTCDEDDPWDSDLALEKANPLFDEPVIRRYKLAQLEEAKRKPEKQSEYQTKHLNRWTNAKNAFFDIDAWRKKGAVPEMKLEDFEGQRCFAGLDMALNNDLSSFVLVFPLAHCNCERTEELIGRGFRAAVFQTSWLPEATVQRVENEKFRQWEQAGVLNVTSGNTADQAEIEEHVAADSRRFRIQKMAYDPKFAEALAQRLQDEHDIEIYQFIQGPVNYTGPAQLTQGMISDGKIAHTGDPLFAWCVSNVIDRGNGRGNLIRLDKESPELKIDPAQAMIMGIALSDLVNPDNRNAAIEAYLNDPIMAV